MIVNLEEAEARLAELDALIATKQESFNSNLNRIMSSNQNTLLLGAMST
jgi:hypothetical protein